MNFFVGNEKIDSSCLKGIIIMVMIIILMRSFKYQFNTEEESENIC